MTVFAQAAQNGFWFVQMMTPTFLPSSAPFWPLAPSAPVTKTAAATASAASETQRNVLRLMLLRPFRRTIDERPQSGWCGRPVTGVRQGEDGLVRRRRQCIRRHTTVARERVKRSRVAAPGRLRPPERPRACRGGRGRRGRRACAAASSSFESIRSSSSVAAARPISASGCRTVVRLKPSHPAMSMSSKPTIESSAGTRTPTRRAASSAPKAITSFAAKTAVGARLRGEEVEAPLVAAVVAELADAAQGLVEPEPARLELLPEAALAVAARRRVLRAGDQRDPPVPQLDHRLGDEPPSALVVGDHRVHRAPSRCSGSRARPGCRARRAPGAACRASPRRRRARRPRRR